MQIALFCKLLLKIHALKIKIEQIKTTILRWYEQNKRLLPWRETRDPYKIWVSEIILQQTQVKTGLSYYLNFVARFPTIEALAEANEEEVLNLWQGLGYYSRARNMHFAAKQIMHDFNGQFPDNYKDILSLKGVGAYTAAAVGSIAFGLSRAVVDGNVIRVVSRLFGISEAVDTAAVIKRINTFADELLDTERPGDFNQAMMEFGALHCTPAKPNCNACPLQKRCSALEYGLVPEIPMKSKKIKQRNRYFYYLVVDDGESFWLQKRQAGDIWQGLYEFPLLEGEKVLSRKALGVIAKDKYLMPDEIFLSLKIWRGPMKHILSHQIIQASFLHYPIGSKNGGVFENCTRVFYRDMKNYPISRLTEIYLEKYHSNNNKAT